MTKTKSNSITIRDVANKAGISVATVSRYLNGTTPVSAEVANRLEQVMAELNYIPHSTARKLATNKTDTIGLLTMDISGDFFAPLMNGIEEITSQNGFDLLIASTRQSQKHQKVIPSIGPHNTDGLLIFANSLDESLLTRYHASGYPMVLIHYSPPRNLPIPCVTVENRSASCKIVEHLIEVHGRRRIVFLRGEEGQEDSYWREMGYQLALQKHSIPFDPHLVAPGEFEREIAAQSIQYLITSGVEFDGVFAGDDEAAVGVLAALKMAGKRVPEEISVVGFDDQRMSPYLNPPLTTVRAHTDEVGRAAAQSLVDLIQIGSAELLTLLPTEIVIRQSCGCKPV